VAEVLLLQKKSMGAGNLEERRRINDEEANMKEKIQKEIMEDKKTGKLDNLNFMECTAS
jgi:hypothetical protein